MSLMSPMSSSPLANLSLSDPRCNNDSCLAFYAAHNLSQATVSYAFQYEYGHWTTWCYLGILVVTMLIYYFQSLTRSGRSPAALAAGGAGPGPGDKAIAAWRSIAYRRASASLTSRWGVPSVGVSLLVLTTFVFFVATTFAVQPYYRDHRGYGSPPIAIRTGLMAVACTPILVALAGKANIVTLLTGIGHEKLNVLHRWLSRMVLFLSVVHTIPFLIAPLNDGGPAALQKQFYKKGGLEYTGVPPLTILVALVALSVRPLRNWAYETFQQLHFWLAVTYIGLMFWHATDEIDSWAYMWATVAVFVASLLARTFYFTRPLNVRSRWLVGAPVSLSALPGDMTQIRIYCPRDWHFRWLPGQHIYIRFPKIAPLDNHPFTICNAPPPKLATGEEESHRTDEDTYLAVFARTHTGFTSRLAAFVASDKEATVSAWVDGPHGGIRTDILMAYDNLVLVAGGSGITSCVAWLQHATNRMLANSVDKANGKAKTSRVTLLWMIKEPEHFEWLRSEIVAAAEIGREAGGDVSVCVRITGAVDEKQVSKVGGTSSAAPESKDDDAITPKEAVLESKTSSTAVKFQAGRPQIADILPEYFSAGRNLVFVCGPSSLNVDAANSVAREQRRVLQSKKGESGAIAEIALHTETFGW